MLNRDDFQRDLTSLYRGRWSQDIASIFLVYFVLSLGTVCETDVNIVTRSSATHEWPRHDEFYQRGLCFKPESPDSIQCLQGLILLHRYLFLQVSSIYLPDAAIV